MRRFFANYGRPLVNLHPDTAELQGRVKDHHAVWNIRCEYFSSYPACVRYVPVPAKAAASGLPAPLSVTKTLALCSPVFFGLKVTVTLQVAPGASS
jgi:hypothetical protein